MKNFYFLIIIFIIACRGEKIIVPVYLTIDCFKDEIIVPLGGQVDTYCVIKKNGIIANLNFSCQNLPAGLSCSFYPFDNSLGILLKASNSAEVGHHIVNIIVKGDNSYQQASIKVNIISFDIVCPFGYLPVPIPIGGKNEIKCELRLYGYLNRLIEISCLDGEKDIKCSVNPNILNVNSPGTKFIYFKLKAGDIEAGAYTLKIIAKTNNEKREWGLPITIFPPNASLEIDCEKKLWTVYSDYYSVDQGKCTISSRNFCSYIDLNCKFSKCYLECYPYYFLVCNKSISLELRLSYYPEDCWAEPGIYPLEIAVFGYDKGVKGTFYGKLMIKPSQ